MKWRLFFCFFCCFVELASLRAGTILHSITEIEQEVQDWLKSELFMQLPPDDFEVLKVFIRSIDPRYVLEQCKQPLEFSLSGQSIQRNLSVNVACKGAVPWSLYVKASLELEKPILITQRSLTKGERLTNSDLIFSKRDIFALRNGYVVDLEDAIGKRLKRSLGSGEIVYQFQLVEPKVIKRGDVVRVQLQRGNLNVVSSAIALSDAKKGQTLRVKNSKTSKIILVKATSEGEVKVL